MGGGHEVVYNWFKEVQGFIVRGRQVILFLGKIMDDDGLNTINEYRDFWFQIYQLATSIFSGVFGLEHRLDFAISVYPSLCRL